MITNGDNPFINRTTLLTFCANHQGVDAPVSFVFGNGLGIFYQQIEARMDIRCRRDDIRLTAASTLLWDMAIFDHGLLATIQTILSLSSFYIFYRLSLLETLSFHIVFVTVLRYLACLYHRHVGSIARSRP